MPRLLMKDEDFGSRRVLCNIQRLSNRFRIGGMPFTRGIMIGVIRVAMDDVNDLEINRLRGVDFVRGFFRRKRDVSAFRGGTADQQDRRPRQGGDDAEKTE